MRFFSFGEVQRHGNLIDPVKSFPNSKEYLIAQVGVETIENEPPKVSRKTRGPNGSSLVVRVGKFPAERELCRCDHFNMR